MGIPGEQAESREPWRFLEVMAVRMSRDILPLQGQAQGRGFGLGEERRPLEVPVSATPL